MIPTLISLRTVMRRQSIDERALPRSRRARHSDHKRVAGVRENPLQEILSPRIVVLNGTNRAGNGADIPGAYLFGPRFSFNECGHGFS